MPDYAPLELALIGLSVFMLAMSKGGFPIGPVALPLLVLIWPDETQAARTAVAFMLPILCAMDLVAVWIYRHDILWKRLLPLAPGTLVGVAVASVLFVSNEGALVAVSDRALKVCIGAVGLLFVLYQASRKWVVHRIEQGRPPQRTQTAAFGFGAGLTSTLAHAAGPLLQMYLLPQHLPKLNFAGTLAGFFFALNLVKLVPFALLGRLTTGNLSLALRMLPIIPLGVLGGYLLVKVMPGDAYRRFIYLILAVTSCTLIARSL